MTPGSLIWTQRQRVVLMVIVGALLLGLGVRYWMNQAYIADPQPEESDRSSELANRIDPNTADANELAALPSIGPAMATRIIEDRDAFRSAHPGQTPYTKLDDLLRVKGIGEATIRTIETYLIFPDDRPATRP